MQGKPAKCRQWSALQKQASLRAHVVGPSSARNGAHVGLLKNWLPHVWKQAQCRLKTGTRCPLKFRIAYNGSRFAMHSWPYCGVCADSTSPAISAAQAPSSLMCRPDNEVAVDWLASPKQVESSQSAPWSSNLTTGLLHGVHRYCTAAG